MWSYLNKECNCPTTPTNIVENPTCNDYTLTSDMFIYDGDLFDCAGIEKQDDVSTVLQKIDYYLCSLQYAQHFITQIENNNILWEEFITRVNNAINCETITECGNPPITTTTTTTTIN